MSASYLRSSRRITVPETLLDYLERRFLVRIGVTTELAVADCHMVDDVQCEGVHNVVG